MRDGVSFLRGDSTAELDIYQSILRCRAGDDPASDPHLEAEVLRFSKLSPVMAAIFERSPLVLAREASPNMEMMRFLRLSKIVGRPALVSTMPQNRFTPATNPAKRRLAKLPVAFRNGSMRHVNVVSFDEMDGLPFAEMHCRDGTPFVDLHAELMQIAIAPHSRPVTLDMTSFWGDRGAREYYARFLSLFTCFGVLAESFSAFGYEKSFTDNIILPAIEHVTAHFGIAPRILRLLPPGGELDMVWETYPNSVMERVMLATRRPPQTKSLDQ